MGKSSSDLPMKIRVDKWLANSGFGSRKEVKDLVRQGRVLVNGQFVHEGKTKIGEEDRVEVDGQPSTYAPYVYYLLNKPKGVISASRDRRETVLDLLKEEDRREGLFPVGRLDRDTTGLLLLTNDGRLAHKLLSPGRKVKKHYLALLDKDIDSEDQRHFQEGFDLSPEQIHTKPARLIRRKACLAEVEIVEGKYHQVKRMFALCGKEVLALRRLSMGPLQLDVELKEGEYRPLTEEEQQALLEATGESR